jgi:hypothetical protein
LRKQAGEQWFAPAFPPLRSPLLKFRILSQEPKKALQSQSMPHSETASGEVAEWSKALPC